ncbi:MAG: type II toxin-antitoxin system RelE/ParE family toxin [Planctomycetota bacterium]|jgi:plasmid stabilization system protein ParE|nr:type II toxin-antitoxin system RelE/ParE family toxin [Planctomycetota bacterium]
MPEWKKNMASVWSIRYSLDSEADLNEIYDYIVDVSGESLTATKFIRRLRLTIEKLSYLPHRYPLYLSCGVRRMNIGKYSVFYVIDTARRSVVVNRILHGARHLDALLTGDDGDDNE